MVGLAGGAVKVTGVAKRTGRRVFGGRAFVTGPSRARRRRAAAFRAAVIAAVVALLALEACLFLLTLSKGSPSWRAGYAVGHHLGRAAVRNSVGQPPVVPPEKDCTPTRRQVDEGISTRKVVVPAHQLDIGEFRVGCAAGYSVATSR